MDVRRTKASISFKTNSAVKGPLCAQFPCAFAHCHSRQILTLDAYLPNNIRGGHNPLQYEYEYESMLFSDGGAVVGEQQDYASRFVA